MIASLHQIGHSLGNIDKTITLLHRLTIESLHHTVFLAKVIGYLAQGHGQYLYRIVGSHKHLAKHDGTGLHHHRDILAAGIHLHITAAVSQVRHHDSLYGRSTLDDKAAVVVGHRRDITSGHGDISLSQQGLRFSILDDTCHDRQIGLCHYCYRPQQQHHCGYSLFAIHRLSF